MNVRWALVLLGVCYAGVFYAGVFYAGVARAQSPYEGQPLDIYSGVVTAPAGILAQGGAYIGVAEGAAGIKFNPASIPNRFAYFTDEYWDWDWNLDFTVLGVADDQDLFNSGRSRIDVERLQKVNMALDLQIGRFGLGVSISNTEISECDSGNTDCLPIGSEQRGTTTRISTIRLGGGYALLGGDLMLGASVFAPSIQFVINGDDSGSPGISGGTLEFGALWRPAGERYRIGATFRPRTRALIDSDVAGTTIAGRLVPPSLVSPWTLGVGASYAFGTRPMNLRPSFGSPEETHDDYNAYARGHYQAALDLIVVGANSNSVGLDGWFEQEAQAAGRKVRVAVHAGVQGEVVEDLMVARLGAYLEPSRFGETRGRPHTTGGLDFRLFELVWVWRAGFAFDIARNFNQLTLSGGFWY